tara:strand:+ start:145 stop:1332 length:1188 start_codon:yes stop_codon:yes gene_type:complete
MKVLNFDETQTAVTLCMKADVVAFIFGHQGMGKSACIKQLAEHINIQLLDMRLSQIEGIDLRGLMAIDKGVTKYYPPSFLAPLLKKEYHKLEANKKKDWEGILFQDEYMLGDTDTRKAAMQLTTDRRIGEFVFSDKVYPVMASNRTQDETMQGKLSGPEANRFAIWEMDYDVEQFNKAAVSGFQSDYSHLPVWNDLPEPISREDKTPIDGRIRFFCANQDTTTNPVFKNFDRASFKSGSFAHATPRSWHAVSRILQVCDRDPDIWENLPNFKSIRRALVCGLVGDGVGTSFTGMIDQLDKLVDIEDVKNRGDKAKLPDQKDPMCVGICWISVGVLTNERHFNSETADNIIKYINKLGTICSELPQTAKAMIEGTNCESIQKAIENSKEYHHLAAA